MPDIDDIEDEVIRRELPMYIERIIREIIQFENGGYYDETVIDRNLDLIRSLLDARIDFED